MEFARQQHMLKLRSEAREPISPKARRKLTLHHDSWGRNPSAFFLNLMLSRRDVTLLGRFCAELRQQHLKLGGAFSDHQTTELLQLLNQINNHIVAGQLPNRPDTGLTRERYSG